MASRAPFAASALNLSAPESFLLSNRLSSIQESIRTAPSPFETALTESLKDVVVIFPGAGGVDSLTTELQDRIASSDKDDAKLTHPRHICTFDWLEHRGTVATAAFDGEAVGESVAEILLKECEGRGIELRSVHGIGISVGAFAGNQFARTVKRSCFTAHVRLTLLDPFCSRGLLGVGYGARNFGLDVDYAEQYMNRDDPVPTTNDPLPLCACWDVTAAEEREMFVLPKGESMHCWPVAYFSRFRYQSKGCSEGGSTRISLPRYKAGSKIERGGVMEI